MESSNVDDRTEHEMYGHPFLRSVMAGVAAVMCSYSAYPWPPLVRVRAVLICKNLEFVDQINETYACENDRTLNQILKGEIGFRGCGCACWLLRRLLKEMFADIMSDWGAHHATLDAIQGLDVSDLH